MTAEEKMFTDEEIKAAKKTKQLIISGEVPTELASIYMAGEICMWDELQSKAASLSSLEGEKIKGWIYSDEQLPDFDEVTDLAVIRRSDNEIFTWRFEKGYTWNPENFKYRFSRWMPLPKPPVQSREDCNKCDGTGKGHFAGWPAQQQNCIWCNGNGKI